MNTHIGALISSHNLCLPLEIRKISKLFGWKKEPYLEHILTYLCLGLTVLSTVFHSGSDMLRMQAKVSLCIL